MKIYLDTEFNGLGGELISLALVSEDGREWYESLPLPPLLDEWVGANVVPLLGDKPPLHNALSDARALRDWHVKSI